MEGAEDMTQHVLTGPGAAHDDMPDLDDLSRPALARPPLPATPGVPQPVRRVERCVCGGYLLQLASETIPEVQAIHNSTPAHTAWRNRRVA